MGILCGTTVAISQFDDVIAFVQAAILNTKIGRMRKGMNEYAEEASSWKRFAFPHIRGMLSPDIRDEFDKECAKLLSFPSGEEFRRSPMMRRTTYAE